MMCEGVEQETGNGKSGAEIDIFESPYYARRQNGLVTCNLHYDGYGRAHRTKNAGIISMRRSMIMAWSGTSGNIFFTLTAWRAAG